MRRDLGGITGRVLSGGSGGLGSPAPEEGADGWGSGSGNNSVCTGADDVTSGGGASGATAPPQVGGQQVQTVQP